MIHDSIFFQLSCYFRSVFRAVRSIVISCLTALPYLARWGDLRKEVTEEYPDPVSSRMADDLPLRSRGLLFNAIDVCTGCRECEKACPAHCIRVETEPGPEASKIWVAVFDIDFARCMFCGLCTLVCEPGSLRHTRQYEGATYLLADLVASFGRGQVTEAQRAKWALLRKLVDEDEIN